MREFNLEEAKAGKPVCTRDGKDARIISFDYKRDYPIVAAIGADGKEKFGVYTSAGRVNNEQTWNIDLFMKEEEPTLKDYTSIKSYEDACKALGEIPMMDNLWVKDEKVGYFSRQDEWKKVHKHIIALMKLETISRALRGNWKPVKEETVFVPKLIDGEIIAGVRSYHKYTTDSHFTQQTSEKAKYFGKQFIDLWKEYLMGE